jgi:hypothetical protein
VAHQSVLDEAPLGVPNRQVVAHTPPLDALVLIQVEALGFSLRRLVKCYLIVIAICNSLHLHG